MGKLGAKRQRINQAVFKHVRPLFRRAGFNLEACDPQTKLPIDFESRHVEIFNKVKGLTLTSPERIYALINATEHIVRNRIDGAFVECGVFKGGSTMVMALTLLSHGVSDRDLFLFDTFSGMPKPDARDENAYGVQAADKFASKRIDDFSSDWVRAQLDSVQDAMAQTRYPSDRVQFVKGLVEDTIPGHAPEKIALLRLDTDFYQSTMHELEYLYPLVATGGIVIIDDYGMWQGAREAVDEYFGRQPNGIPLLHRLDFSARLIVKTAY